VRRSRRNRITVDELRAAARRQRIARLEDVEWAVLETGRHAAGVVSVTNVNEVRPLSIACRSS
jgi:uncharacterized membrane protein YcaP (DUF421 family)